jgi:hypothetical protein
LSEKEGLGLPVVMELVWCEYVSWQASDEGDGGNRPQRPLRSLKLPDYDSSSCGAECKIRDGVMKVGYYRRGGRLWGSASEHIRHM